MDDKSGDRVGGIWYPWAGEDWGPTSFWVVQVVGGAVALLFGGLGVLVLPALLLVWSPRTRWLILPVAGLLGLFKYFVLVLPEM